MSEDFIHILHYILIPITLLLLLNRTFYEKYRNILGPIMTIIAFIFFIHILQIIFESKEPKKTVIFFISAIIVFILIVSILRFIRRR